MMRAGNELVDTVFIVFEERVDSFLIYDTGALGLGKNEVEEE